MKTDLICYIIIFIRFDDNNNKVLFIGTINYHCGGNYTIERNYYYTILSKNYPHNYDNNLGCYYTISVGDENGFNPQLDFVDVELASGDTISVSC